MLAEVDLSELLSLIATLHTRREIKIDLEQQTTLLGLLEERVKDIVLTKGKISGKTLSRTCQVYSNVQWDSPTLWNLVVE